MNSCCIIIPTYNTGQRLLNTVQDVLSFDLPIWVIFDGCTDQSENLLRDLKIQHAQLHLFSFDSNQGKGAAVLFGLQAARHAGHTHAIVMDADGQHPASSLPNFLQLSHCHPQSAILGVPIFGPEAPKIRVWGRKIGNFLTQCATGTCDIQDSLFGYRLYPIAASCSILEKISSARRFDFDTELAVRLSWSGVPFLSLPVPVVYWSKQEGGVSHFRYWRDNLVLLKMHCRLLSLRWISELKRKRNGAPQNPD